MLKEHLHRFSRGLRIGLKLLLVIVLIGLMAWGLLLVRLSQGPVNADFLTRRVEKSFHEQQPGFNFTVGSTIMTWGGAGKPIIDRLAEAFVRDRHDGEPRARRVEYAQMREQVRRRLDQVTGRREVERRRGRWRIRAERSTGCIWPARATCAARTAASSGR